MADESNLLSTPEGYATPQQLAATREYAKALMYGNQQQPVTHWAQGMSNMVNALMGQNELKKAGQQEVGMFSSAAKNIPSFVGGSENSNTPSNDAAPTAGVKPEHAHAISQIESGGKYDLVGPATKTGDRAYGKYQVMGANVPEWTQAALGRKMTPQEFLADTSAQEAVFKHRFGSYLDKYGNPQDAASAWFTGGPLSAGAGKRDVLGTSGQGYVDKFNKFLAQGAPQGQMPPGGPQMAQALPFSGEPVNGPPSAGAAPDAPTAITRALAAGKASQGSGVPPIPGVAKPVAATGPDTGTGQIIDPATAPHRIPVSREQMIAIMSNPYAPQQLKDYILSLYHAQGQPMEAAVTGGKVVIGPNGAQRAVPDLEKGTVHGPDGMQFPAPWTFQPDGSVKYAPQSTGGAAGSPQAPTSPQAAPQSAPQTAPQGAQPPQGEGLEGVPNLLKFAPDGGGEPEKPPTPGGMLGTPPPEAGNTKMAGSVVPPSIMDTMEDMKQRSIQWKGQEKAAEQAAEKYSKTYDTVSTGAALAQRGLPQLALARTAIEDPNFYSGIGGNLVLDYNKIKAALGINPNAAAATELFQKIMSGSIVEDMKIMLQGLGQVRVAEINLLSQATANLHNSVPANRAVLDMLQKTHQQAQTMGTLATSYAQGIRWDKDGNPYRAYNRPTGLDYGFDEVRSKYLKAHPLFTPEEIKNYKTMFEKEPGYNKDKVAKTDAVYQAAASGKPTAPAGPATVPQTQAPVSGQGGGLPPGFVLDKK